MKVCYTALFSDYEELKTPKVITEGWKYICYTDQDLKSDVWEIRHVRLKDRVTTMPSQLEARFYKIIMFQQWEQSIWVDASFQIDTDLNKWWADHFKGGLCAASHPLRNDVYAECLDCIIAQRGDKKQVQDQMEEYKSLGIPANNGLIQSGILLRENSPEVIELCKNWWEEVRTHSTRDQIAFAKVSLNSKIVHTYQWDYRQRKDFNYFHHYARRGGPHIPMT